MVLAVVAATAALAGGSGVLTGSEAPSAAPAHSGHPDHSSHVGRPGVPARALTVEQLATTLGCPAKVTLTAADYSQATCHDLVFVNFATAEGQRAWLDGSEMYGGVYLVGERWALSGNSADYLETVQGVLGGTIERTDGHGQ